MYTFLVTSEDTDEYYVSSDNDKKDQNTEEDVYPVVRRYRFRKNKHVQDDEDDEDSDFESVQDSMKIPEQELDHTLYDDYTHSYALRRRGVVDITKDAIEVRGVYRNRRFITTVLKSFYCSARCIPYPLLTRSDGIGGVKGRHFLYKSKRILPDFSDPKLQNPCIDLNELQNWGRKGVIFGNRRDVLNVEMVPFVVGRGGRVKKTNEEQEVNVDSFENIFSNLKVAIHGRKSLEMVTDTEMPKHFPREIPREEHMEDAYGRFNDMEVATQASHLIAQVNLEIVGMVEENEKREREGSSPRHVIDGVTRLQIYNRLAGLTSRDGLEDSDDSQATILLESPSNRGHMEEIISDPRLDESMEKDDENEET